MTFLGHTVIAGIPDQMKESKLHTHNYCVLPDCAGCSKV